MCYLVNCSANDGTRPKKSCLVEMALDFAFDQVHSVLQSFSHSWCLRSRLRLAHVWYEPDLGRSKDQLVYFAKACTPHRGLNTSTTLGRPAIAGPEKGSDYLPL
ncbi:hypothetical protein CDAR_301561 [Caerostris darwini]|uniref:Uncharacterized protein n=1 Tax=Caerostris darwini TaxID=1538125 RepID=A0AAV4TQW0_9ARAC|nr:hypothetical protein CDAR_301561 [Caerostris darwini]